MMRPGVAGGAKARATNIVKNAMDIIAIRTKKNPLEIHVRPIENAAPAEDVTTIAYGGIVYPISVDIAPQRRVDIALRYITNLSRQASHNNPRSVDECLADELILAAARDPKSASVRKRDEIERITLSSRYANLIFSQGLRYSSISEGEETLHQSQHLPSAMQDTHTRDNQLAKHSGQSILACTC